MIIIFRLSLFMYDKSQLYSLVSDALPSLQFINLYSDKMSIHALLIYL